MKRIFFATTILLLLVFFAGGGWYLSKFNNDGAPKNTTVLNKPILIRLNSKAASAKEFVANNGFNSSFCFMIDMSLESGSNRFFVYDLQKDSILQSGLVTHGRCNQDWLTGRKYGNEVGCGCSSLGKYKVGISYKGRFGLAYKLHGLDSTNSNAFKRYVVLHSHSCVPNQEVSPAPICQSDGCPTVSPSFLTQLAVRLDQSEKPVLLWMYE